MNTQRFIVMIGTTLVVILGVYAYMTTASLRIKAQERDSAIVSLNHAQQQYRRDSLCTSLEGTPLHEVLGINSQVFTSIAASNDVTSPFVVLVVKDIDCTSCYERETITLRRLLQQGTTIALVADKEAEFVQKDFRNTLVLLPPPFVKDFVASFPEKMALLCVLPSGKIVYAHIPDKRYPEQSAAFYRRAALFLDTNH
jgi:type II secretory pathway pseudopilin PulG